MTETYLINCQFVTENPVKSIETVDKWQAHL